MSCGNEPRAASSARFPAPPIPRTSLPVGRSVGGEVDGGQCSPFPGGMSPPVADGHKCTVRHPHLRPQGHYPPPTGQNKRGEQPGPGRWTPANSPPLSGRPGPTEESGAVSRSPAVSSVTSFQSRSAQPDLPSYQSCRGYQSGEITPSGPRLSCPPALDVADGAVTLFVLAGDRQSLRTISSVG